MLATTPDSNSTRMFAVSKASEPLRSATSGWTMLDPRARMRLGSSFRMKQLMSRSWMAMSLKIPPPPSTYVLGGGEGSLEHKRSCTGRPASPVSTAIFKRWKLASNRLWNAVISFTFLCSQSRTTSTVSCRSNASGFSQKMCFPAAAEWRIWSEWNWLGEQIHTASTSASAITSCASVVKRDTPKSWQAPTAAASTWSATTSTCTKGLLESADKWARPMRPQPMTPTLVCGRLPTP
mmetsp:Transcript_17093/g.65166  ORF Transcript_17093/g.65166 Transcript_17093/m.65166 type:complete len:236 (+) Transcript_17093:3696-4403(+)